MITNKQKAFTLVELLTVIAIISILAGILVPVVGSARAKGRTAGCISNLRQIGIAFQLFAISNHDSLPCGYYRGSSAELMWDEAISPYLQRDFANESGGAQNITAGTEVFACPADEPSTGAARRSYSMAKGVAATSDADKSDNKIGLRLASIPDRANTLLVTDRSASSNYVGAFACWDIGGPNTQISGGLGRELHNNRFNYLYIDGHVSTRRPEDTVGAGSMSSPKGMWTTIQGD